MNASSQNILNHEPHKLIINVKELRNTKTYAHYLISFVLLAILGVSFGFSSLLYSTIIGSSGRIAIPVPSDYKSEVRGVFIHDLNFVNPNWEVITETCSQHGINAIYAHMITCARSSRFPTTVHSSFHTWIESRDHLRELLDAAHAREIEVHVAMIWGSVPRLNDHRALTSTGTVATWASAARTLNITMDILEELITNYPDIDGFMWDYIRYATSNVDYSPEAKAWFEEWLGEGTITDWTPFYSDGARYHSDFREFRHYTISELVRQGSVLLRSYKSNIKISAAVFPFVPNSPIYQKKWIAQDTFKWVKEGWVDVIAPMHYLRGVAIGGTDPLGTLEDYFYWETEHLLKAPEGIKEYLSFQRIYYPGQSQDPIEFASMILKMRELGTDGWIIWHYGGPGDNSPAPDIRDYLELIPMPDVFAMGNIQVQPGATEANVTWLTSLPASSKVEFSDSPLFTYTWTLWSDTWYWKPSYNAGTIIEDPTPKTIHSITLTGLTPLTKYYFRVQSQDPSGIATSKVLTFTTP